MVDAPVELLVLQFPGERPDERSVAEVRAVIEQKIVTILDLLHVVRSPHGEVEVIEVDPSSYGLTGAKPLRIELVSEVDAEAIGRGIPDGTCAVVLVYEQTWAARIAMLIRESGGEVALHVSIPPETVALATASTAS